MIVEATIADFDALIRGADVNGCRVAAGGIETPEVLAMLKNLAANVGADFKPAAWMIVDHGIIIGLCSLLTPPDAAGVIAIGYGIDTQYRGQGHGTRAIHDIADWARRHHSISAITAETASDNYPSQQILRNNGFIKSGERHDAQDGDLYCWLYCWQLSVA
jgi:RimJ/RimL family protein N-acetyltransferase